ncbi:MAG: trigger factor [bacterium]|nr:trigger factor [Candidatus Jorgensenbacteria bacterium]
MEDKKLYTNLKVGKPKDSVIEIEGEIPTNIIEFHRQEVLDEVKQEAEIPGFRKGNAPEEMVLKQLDMNHVLEDAAEEALSIAYPAILDDNHIVPISSPRVTFVKLALGSPLEFKISIAVEPEVDLPNYKKIAKAVKDTKKQAEATDEEVEEIIKQLLTMRQGEDGKLPELTDDFVKTIGKFENVVDFKEKLKTNIKAEKEMESARMRYEELAKKLADESKIKLPSLLVEDEMYAAHGRLHRELEKRKMSEEDYFKLIKKTEEEYMKERKEAIERQFKTKFILKAIATKEGIKADEKEVEKEVEHAATHYTDTNPEAFRSYIEEMLTNEKTLKFLEEASW